MLRAATVLTVAAAAAAAAAAGPPSAAAAGWPMALPAAGYCVPAPDDGLYVPRAVKALEVPATPTDPIAILDTGVDPDAPQFGGRVLPGVDALTGATVADDPDGHGTQAAGLAASSGPGMRGISPASPILPVRVYNGDRISSADSVAKGIAAAVQRGAGVVVLEGSGPLDGTPEEDVLKVTKAIDDAFGKGVLVVAGSGDDSATAPTFPAALPHVLVAGSVTTAGTRSTPTTTGPWLDLLVPAEGIEGPLPPALCAHGFGFSGGTSFAAPSLGGAAALIKAQRPGLTNQQYFEIVRRAAADIGATGRDNDSGFGILDVAAGIAAAPQTKETSREVDDDPYWVRGRYAKQHPALLTSKKLRFKAQGSVSATKDPADVYRVSLGKGERLVVSAKAADPTHLLELAVLRPAASDFDVTEGDPENVAVGTAGLQTDPQLELRASRSGTYFIAVVAPDAIDAADPTLVPADLEPYTLSAYKQKAKKKKAKAKK